MCVCECVCERENVGVGVCERERVNSVCVSYLLLVGVKTHLFST